MNTVSEDDTFLRGKRILLVDDDTLLADIIAVRLGHEAAFSRHVTKGSDALRAAREFQPDIILLDMQLPEVDGVTVLRQLKEDAELKRIPVVIFSNFSDPEKVEECKQLGVKGYYIKSLTPPHDTIEIIKKALGGTPHFEE